LVPILDKDEVVDVLAGELDLAADGEVGGVEFEPGEGSRGESGEQTIFVGGMHGVTIQNRVASVIQVPPPSGFLDMPRSWGSFRHSRKKCLTISDIRQTIRIQASTTLVIKG
jgi:hypothetical protein